MKQKTIVVVSLLFSCSTHPPEAQLIQHWRKDTTGGRHLVHFKRKLKRMNTKRSKRKDSPVRLYKTCIRMRPRVNGNAHTVITQNKSINKNSTNVQWENNSNTTALLKQFIAYIKSQWGKLFYFFNSQVT